MSEELKPCPFCGGEAKLVKIERDNYPYGTCDYICYVLCKNCGVTGKTFSSENQNEYKETEAITAWNTRFQAEPKALTLVELSKMTNTDWVWIVYPDMAYYEYGWQRAANIYNRFAHELYGKTWLAYDKPPKED